LLENLFKCVCKDGSFGFAELRPHCVRNSKMANQHRLMQIRKDLITEIQSLIAASKEAAIRSVDHHRVLLYWHIGQKIFEEEQGAKDRADYGAYLLKFLAQELEPVYGSGFSRRQLELCRQFYRVFPIANAVRSQFSWTHYRMFIRIDNQDKREFYMAEAEKNNWTARQLERQINSQLFERLLLSKDVQSVLAVARAEKQPSDARDIIKDPMVLEFLDLKQQAAYYERDLETALITHLQEFLLELGNGFSFVARQKRIHIDGDEFFIDLVFYNRLLQCFVLLELKTTKLTHEALGQLQMYVNYFDRFEKQAFENPTIGILLCTDKNDAMVKISLPEANKTIVASKYQLYLPSERQLIEELKKTIQEAAGKDA
jgi:predicted nuclease of restriction endonuclease-like (RecB) superfamily